ncbi:N-acetyltransferase [Halopenitus sp. POP-27]|uniref:acyltransferase n=1 Tax=Halopenitus sp. POP-27 TaxID=2994425 RepID=UPI0024685150|nr:N-acetyltransferase [Halopenitus sp. POP-27]
MTEISQGNGCEIDSGATVGYEYSEDTTPTEFGDDVIVRAGSIVYNDVEIAARTQTGHNVLIREHTKIGTDCVIGTDTVIDGHTQVGNNVSLQTGVYVPSHTEIGDQVFIGPRAVLTNDPYPVRQDVDLEGPTVESSASIGANSTILPGTHIGERSFVAAGAIVTEDVPPETLAVGAPATFKPLPEQLRDENDI